MPKAIISNRIYLDTTPELTKVLQKALTYKIRKPPRPGLTHFSMFDIVKSYKMISSKVISIPIGRGDLIPEDYEVVDKRISHDMPFPNPKHPLRPGQQLVYDEVDDNCLINAAVGWGKTFTALHIARKLGQKTLIVCHNTMIRDMWKQEIEALFGMDAGIIGSGKMDHDYPITVGNIQTLTKVVGEISKEFGLVIVDECHHVSASTFSTFVDAMYCRYKIGLSGTITRKDGKQVMFKDFFSPKLLQPAESDTMTPRVRIIKTGVHLDPGATWAEKLNKLLYDPEYQGFIAKVAQIQMDKGYKVLIIADRVEFLINVGELIGEKCVCITGGTSFEEREGLKAQIESGKKDCVAGSRQIFAEGISINPLSCVILAGPISAPAYADGLIDQIIGRIRRLFPGKLQPLVLDMNFADSGSRKQNKERLDFYKRKGWDIVEHDV
jgi:superfamily II DNA or RNA helicase